MDICGQGWDWQNGKRHPGQIIYGQNTGRTWQEMLCWGRSIKGQLKNQSLITPEDYEESISLTLRTKSSKKPLGMQEENWKHQWHQPCLARLARKGTMGRPVAKLMISNLNFRVSWKPVSPQECVWKNLFQITTRTIMQEEVTIHYNITVWYTNLFLCLKQWRYPQQKQQWMKNGRNLKRFRRGTWLKSETNQRWSMKQGRRAQKFILPHWWTYVIWRMPNWRQSTEKTKVESYSEPTLWKMILDLMQYSPNEDHQHHKWLPPKSWISYPDCQGAQDKQLIHYLLNPSQNGRCSKIVENSQIGNSRHLDRSTTTQVAQIMVQYGRPSRSSWTKSVRSSFGRTIVRKAIWENPIETWMGENSKLGMSLRSSWKGIILICVCGWHQNWLERNKILIRCGKYWTKKLIWETQHLS